MRHKRDLSRGLCSHGGASDPQGQKRAAAKLGWEQIRGFPPSSSSLPGAAPVFLHRPSPGLGVLLGLSSKAAKEQEACWAPALPGMSIPGHKHPRAQASQEQRRDPSTCCLPAAVKGTKQAQADTAIKSSSMDLIFPVNAINHTAHVRGLMHI